MSSQDEKAEVLKECRRYFSEIDSNGDGKINPVEFSAMCKNIGCSTDLATLKQSYKKADRNGDGAVSFVEFMDAFTNNINNNNNSNNNNNNNNSNTSNNFNDISNNNNKSDSRNKNEDDNKFQKGFRSEKSESKNGDVKEDKEEVIRCVQFLIEFFSLSHF